MRLTPAQLDELRQRAEGYQDTDPQDMIALLDDLAEAKAEVVVPRQAIEEEVLRRVETWNAAGAAIVKQLRECGLGRPR